MIVAVKKYNPGFLTDEQIIESFCVRTNEFESIIESLRENAGNSNPHTIVIGPRGSGKTHLLMRIAAEVRRNAELNAYFPIIFPEESYEVSTCGELWLECLYHLAQQAYSDERNNLELTHNDLRNEANDQVLAERCIGALLDFADRRQKRLLLVVENLNMLFNDIGDPEVGWRLRKTLQTEPRIMLLASATSRFGEIDSPDCAMYDLFRAIALHPLGTEECQTLWHTVSGTDSPSEAVRPIEILTGGNPRLLSVIATFGAGQSLRELMHNLLDLVDDHTEYFKSHLEALPPQERRVYLGLARLWRPSTTKEIADQARIDTNRCSAFLKRLTRRGIVTNAGGTARRPRYYLTERLYNIYYLLRRGAGANNLVKALIDFMICMYSPASLVDIYQKSLGETRELERLLPNIGGRVAEALIAEALSLEMAGSPNKALDLYNQVIESIGSDDRDGVELDSSAETLVGGVLLNKSLLLSRLGRAEEVIETSEVLLKCFGKHETFDFPIAVTILKEKARAHLSLDNFHEAIETYDEAIDRLNEIEPPDLNSLLAEANLGKGWAFARSGQYSAAAAALDQVVNLVGESRDSEAARALANALIYKAYALFWNDQSISADEFSRLLSSLADLEELPAGSVAACLLFIATAGSARAFELIQASPSAHRLLPLVTALEQELEQITQEATEVEEVAKDVRKIFSQLRNSIEGVP